MNTFIAALPMYDWPETRAETDAEWARLRSRFVAGGIDAPHHLTRRNGDMPPVPGGILDSAGQFVAPDPATLPADELDLHVLWRHPRLLFAQTCWGPLETTGLGDHVRVLAQPDYSAFEGGRGTMYRSALVMRGGTRRAAPSTEDAVLPVEVLRGARLAFNGPDSMSGVIALRRDLVSHGAIPDEAGFAAYWSAMLRTGGHRQSVIAVAEGKADVAAIDCRTLDLCRRFEPAMKELVIVGWTAPRKGLPYVQAIGLGGAAAAR